MPWTNRRHRENLAVKKFDTYIVPYTSTRNLLVLFDTKAVGFGLNHKKIIADVIA